MSLLYSREGLPLDQLPEMSSETRQLDSTVKLDATQELPLRQWDRKVSSAASRKLRPLVAHPALKDFEALVSIFMGDPDYIVNHNEQTFGRIWWRNDKIKVVINNTAVMIHEIEDRRVHYFEWSDKTLPGHYRTPEELAKAAYDKINECEILLLLE